MIESKELKADSDLQILKGIAYHPSLRLVGPFIPFLVNGTEPLSLALLLLPVVDFFIMPGKLSRKYIRGYEKWYLILFFSSLVLRVILEFTPTLYWPIPIILILVVMTKWCSFAWTSWWKLYNSVNGPE